MSALATDWGVVYVIETATRSSALAGILLSETVAPTGSTWSTADASANGFALSNGGMTLTPSGAQTWQTTRSSIGKTSGKLYLEFANGIAASSESIVFGLASSGFIISSYLGTSNYSVGLAINGAGTIVSAGFTSNWAMGLGSPPALNETWALAVDFTAGNVWVAMNNVWLNSSNPVTGTLPVASFVPATVGALFAGISLYGPNIGVWTLQSTATSQKYAPPSGFQAWDSGVVVVVTNQAAALMIGV